MPTSAYIHIPFCKSKCKYCSFVSFSSLEKMPSYILSLLKDIESNYKGEALKTLYFGGGTPSLLDLQYVKRILESFSFQKGCEITFEMNPDDINEVYLKGLYEYGVNRLSLGAQSFDDNVLKLIGRRHTSIQSIDAVKLAQKVGFKNISLDLIYGLPEANLRNDLEIITGLGIQHISTYGLKVEEGSFFYNNLPENLPDDDMQADMYLMLNSFLEAKGYKRYEISNFAKDNFVSRHNLNYWNNDEYYGFGVAAHGYVDGIRYAKTSLIDKYLDFPANRELEHVVTREENLEEEIFLGFRKEAGIDVKKINNKYDLDFSKKYNKILKQYIPKYIVETETGYKLTLDGVLLSNNILSDFL